MNSLKQNLDFNQLKKTLDHWWQYKTENCPLCYKDMKVSSVSNHIRGNFCKCLLKYPPIQRSEISNYYNNLKFKFGGKKILSHEKSVDEIIASTITDI